MFFSCPSHKCLTEQLRSISKFLLQAECIVCVAAAQWASDLVIKLAESTAADTFFFK